MVGRCHDIFSEGFVAQGTFAGVLRFIRSCEITFVPIMTLVVFAQSRAGLETFIAFLTHMRSGVTMRSQMCFHACQLAKSFPTNSTYVGLCPCVDVHVDFKGGFPIESPPTLGAHPRLLPSMSENVIL